MLSATNQSLQIVTNTTADIHYEVSWIDLAASIQTPNSSAGAILTATTTANVVPAPSVGSQRTIVEMTISNVDTTFQIVTIQELVAAATFNLITSINLGPNERIEFTGDRGWRVFDNRGAEKGPIAVALLPSIQPGSFIGLPITIVGASAAVEITGANAGESIRFDTEFQDTTSTGVIADYPLSEDKNWVHFSGATAVTLQGVAITSPTGGTALTPEGKPYIISAGTSSLGLLLVHQSGSEANAGRRFQGPGLIDYQLYHGETALVVRKIISATTSHRIIGRARSAVQANGGAISPVETLNFVSGTGNTASVSVTGGVASIELDQVPTPTFVNFEEDFVVLAGPTVPTGGGSFLTTTSHTWLVLATGNAGSATLAVSAQNNPGVFQLNTGATSGNTVILSHGAATNTPILSGTRCTYFCWIIMLPDITSYSLQCGLSSDWTTPTTPSSCVMFDVSSASGIVANQRSGGVGGTTSSGVSPVVSTFIRLEGNRSGSSWAYSINGAAPFATVASAPAALMNFGLTMGTTTTASRSIAMDQCAYRASLSR